MMVVAAGGLLPLAGCEMGGGPTRGDGPAVVRKADRPASNTQTGRLIAREQDAIPAPQPSERPDEMIREVDLAEGRLVEGVLATGAEGRALEVYGDVLAGGMMGNREPITDPESANVSQVTFSHEGADFDPTISPDGEFIVFASTQHRRTADIYMKRMGSRVVTQLTNDPAHDVMPAISPDGRRVAFASNRAGSWDIYVMSIEGGSALQVTSSRAHELHPSWSPDGRKLVYTRLGETSGRWELWVTNVDSPAVSHFIGYGLFPQWCPVAGTGHSGRDRILYQRGRERGDRAFGVWTIDYKDGNASNPTEIASSAQGALINPSWSPDGRYILYAQIPSTEDWEALANRRPERSNIWMVDINGTNRVKVTTGKTVDLMPTWSRGNRVYFMSDRGGAENLWSMDITSALLAAGGDPGAFATVDPDD